MTGRKTRALQVPPVVPCKALENFSKALYGTSIGTYSARVFRPVMKWIMSLANCELHFICIVMVKSLDWVYMIFEDWSKSCLMGDKIFLKLILEI